MGYGRRRFGFNHIVRNNAAQSVLDIIPPIVIASGHAFGRTSHNKRGRGKL